MNIQQLLQMYRRFDQKFSPRVRQWMRRLSLLLALVTPGLPQIFSKKHILVGSLLFFFGTGALFNLAMGPIYLSDADIQTFDVLHAIAIPNLSDLYPLNIAPSVAAATNLTPIHPVGEPWFVQPLYQELLSIHIILYIGCAILSCWHQWKTQKMKQQ